MEQYRRKGVRGAAASANRVRGEEERLEQQNQLIVDLNGPEGSSAWMSLALPPPSWASRPKRVAFLQRLIREEVEEPAGQDKVNEPLPVPASNVEILSVNNEVEFFTEFYG